MLGQSNVMHGYIKKTRRFETRELAVKGFNAEDRLEVTLVALEGPLLLRSRRNIRVFSHFSARA